MSMEFGTYAWNIVWTLYGAGAFLEYTIKASRSTGSGENFVHTILSGFFGTIGAWNLICLLEKLNIINP